MTEHEFSAQELAAFCARLARIPRDVADYTVDAREALVQFGLDDGHLEPLRRAGLCGRSADGEPRYAVCDLHYIGLRTGLAHDVRAGVTFWRRSLEQLVAAAETTVRVQYVVKLPGETGAADGHVVLPGDPHHPVTLRHLTAAAEFTVTQRASWPRLPDDVAAIVDEVARNEFCTLPDRLIGDTELARRTGMFECRTGTALVVQACARIGRPARIAHGLMLALPFSSPHTWAEIEVEGVWTPVDPLIIDLMRRWAGLDPTSWPHHRSPGAMLVPLLWDLPAPVPLVTRGDRGVQATLLTRVVATTERSAVATPS